MDNWLIQKAIKSKKIEIKLDERSKLVSEQESKKKWLRNWSNRRETKDLQNILEYSEY